MLKVPYGGCGAQMAVRQGSAPVTPEAPEAPKALPSWRTWASQKFPSQYRDKLEVVVFNAMVEFFEVNVDSKRHSVSPALVRLVYNWYTEVVLYFMTEVVEAVTQKMLKPSSVVPFVLRQSCATFPYLSALVPFTLPGDAGCDGHVTEDRRLPTRWYLLRKLRELAQSADGDFFSLTICAECEQSVAEHHAAPSAYRRHTFELLRNMTNKKIGLIDKLRCGAVSVSELGSMTCKKAWPELWQRPELQPGRSVIIICSEQSESSPSLLQCQACKQYKVVYYEMQTRSADEPMSVFCTCTHCGKKWKM
jgi:DNA-directed RNA polymerase subunit M/transcription elongation factor TFIIS